MPVSGPDWVNKFPGSSSLDDLAEPFKTRAAKFIAALKAAKATVHISATFRPPERAYLMHYCASIVRGEDDPAKIPPMAGVDIQWLHKTAAGLADAAASKAAAQAMVTAFGIAFPPVLKSRHTERNAVDMDIAWTGTLTIAKADGTMVTIASTPRDGAGNAELHQVGATYGVIKLVTDHPHWSVDGH